MCVEFSSLAQCSGVLAAVFLVFYGWFQQADTLAFRCSLALTQRHVVVSMCTAHCDDSAVIRPKGSDSGRLCFLAITCTSVEKLLSQMSTCRFEWYLRYFSGLLYCNYLLFAYIITNVISAKNLHQHATSFNRHLLIVFKMLGPMCKKNNSQHKKHGELMFIVNPFVPKTTLVIIFYLCVFLFCWSLNGQTASVEWSTNFIVFCHLTLKIGKYISFLSVAFSSVLLQGIFIQKVEITTSCLILDFEKHM